MNLLCIISSTPFHGSHAIEQLEAAMVGAVFDMQVSILFLGQGATCLIDGQDGSSVGMRTPGNVISGLPMYEIDNIYVDRESLTHLDLKPDQLISPVKVIEVEEQRELLEHADLVFGGA